MEVKPGHVDLEKLGKSYIVGIKSPEHPLEMEARLRNDAADAAHQRIKDLVGFYAAIAGVAGVAILCGYLALAPGSSADEKKWATASLASIVSTGVGIITGKNLK
jgi:hypothetical protein